LIGPIRSSRAAYHQQRLDRHLRRSLVKKVVNKIANV
jgi:hypothetical protein